MGLLLVNLLLILTLALRGFFPGTTCLLVTKVFVIIKGAFELFVVVVLELVQLLFDVNSASFAKRKHDLVVVHVTRADLIDG